MKKHKYITDEKNIETTQFESEEKESLGEFHWRQFKNLKQFRDRIKNILRQHKLFQTKEEFLALFRFEYFELERNLKKDLDDLRNETIEILKKEAKENGKTCTFESEKTTKKTKITDKWSIM